MMAFTYYGDDLRVCTFDDVCVWRNALPENQRHAIQLRASSLIPRGFVVDSETHIDDEIVLTVRVRGSSRLVSARRHPVVSTTAISGTFRTYRLRAGSCAFTSSPGVFAAGHLNALDGYLPSASPRPCSPSFAQNGPARRSRSSSRACAWRPPRGAFAKATDASGEQRYFVAGCARTRPVGRRFAERDRHRRLGIPLKSSLWDAGGALTPPVRQRRRVSPSRPTTRRPLQGRRSSPFTKRMRNCVLRRKRAATAAAGTVQKFRRCGSRAETIVGLAFLDFSAGAPAGSCYFLIGFKPLDVCPMPSRVNSRQVFVSSSLAQREGAFVSKQSGTAEFGLTTNP